MGIIKKLLLFVLVIVASGAGVVYASRYIPEGKLDGVKQVANQVQPFISQNIQQANLGQLPQLGGQLTSQARTLSGKVLGVQDSTPASDSASTASSSANSKSLPQKAFDAARYTYCKEVVKEYESR